MTSITAWKLYNNNLKKHQHGIVIDLFLKRTNASKLTYKYLSEMEVHWGPVPPHAYSPGTSLYESQGQEANPQIARGLYWAVNLDITPVYGSRWQTNASDDYPTGYFWYRFTD